MTKLTDRLVAESSLEFCRVAPRLARAHAHMQEMQRVLGWMAGRWTGGVDMLVDVSQYTHIRGDVRWAAVHSVSTGATPYPIKAEFARHPEMPADRQPGQWAFHEVIDLRHWSDDWPELLEMHPQFPRPLTDLSHLSTTNIERFLP